MKPTITVDDVVHHLEDKILVAQHQCTDTCAFSTLSKNQFLIDHLTEIINATKHAQQQPSIADMIGVEKPTSRSRFTYARGCILFGHVMHYFVIPHDGGVYVNPKVEIALDRNNETTTAPVICDAYLSPNEALQFIGEFNRWLETNNPK